MMAIGESGFSNDGDVDDDLRAELLPGQRFLKSILKSL